MKKIFNKFKAIRWKKWAIIVWVFNIIFFTWLFISHTPIMTEKRCKEYLIENMNDISYNGKADWGEHLHFDIQTDDLDYYEEATIKKFQGGDGYYYIIFWGDRDSWKWNSKLDKAFRIDVNHFKDLDDLDAKLMKKLTIKQMSN